MAIASFGPTAGLFLTATTTSSSAALPTTGTPTIALVTNLSGHPVFVALGSGTVVASTSSTPVMPGASLALTIGTNTNIGAITLSGVAGVSVSVGN